MRPVSVVVRLWLSVVTVVSAVGCGGEPAAPANTLQNGLDTYTPVDLDDTPPLDVPTDVTPGVPFQCNEAGDAGCPCTGNGDCKSGWCIEGLEGSVCTSTCIDECPDGWTCKGLTNTGGDLTYVCVQHHPNLCRPCITDTDCKASVVVGDDRCIPAGDVGSFCGGECSDQVGCPDGYSCKADAVVDGPAQCVPEVSGACVCNDKFIAEAATTVCSVSNDFGTCQAELACKPTGVGGCTAQTPSAETCNGKDDDCDGQTDEDIEPEPCEGAPGQCDGTATCVGGVSVCTAAEKGGEICDGLDNDCDDQVDEGLLDSDQDGLCNDYRPRRRRRWFSG